MPCRLYWTTFFGNRDGEWVVGFLEGTGGCAMVKVSSSSWVMIAGAREDMVNYKVRELTMERPLEL